MGSVTSTHTHTCVYTCMYVCMRLRGKHHCQIKGFLVHMVNSGQPGLRDRSLSQKSKSKQTQSLFLRKCPNLWLVSLISQPHSESLPFLLLAWQLFFPQAFSLSLAFRLIHTYCMMAGPHCQVLSSHNSSLIGDSLWRCLLLRPQPLCLTMSYFFDTIRGYWLTQWFIFCFSPPNCRVLREQIGGCGAISWCRMRVITGIHQLMKNGQMGKPEEL